MISWEGARALVGEIAPMPGEMVALGASLGRRPVDDLTTGIPIPHFASSAMDGWLTAGSGPWDLAADPLHPGQARPIVTGELVPAEATAVLRSENGVVRAGMLHSTHASEPVPGQHIRPAGTEARRGETLIAAGTMLTPAHLALMASAGIDSLAVTGRPDVSMVFTGDEIVTEGVPQPGRVRDSFELALPPLLESMGAPVRDAMRIPDQLPATIDALMAASSSLIVTTGGTGTSTADHLRTALAHVGARLLIDGIAMRPGGPTALAELPDGRLVLGLPGNPLAAFVVAITIGEPLIAALSGRPPVPTRQLVGPLVAGRPGSTRLMPFALIDGRAAVSAWQGAGMMRGLATADGLLVVPEGGVAEGDRAACVDLPWRARITL